MLLQAFDGFKEVTDFGGHGHSPTYVCEHKVTSVCMQLKLAVVMR